MTTTLKRTCGLCLFFLSALFFPNQLAWANLIVLGQQKTISSPPTVPTTEEIEIYLDLTGMQDSGSIPTAGWQVRVELTGPNAGSDVAITGIGDTVDHPQAPKALGPVDSFTATEAFRGVISFTDFELHDQEGFMRVNLAMAPGAAGDYDLSILTATDDTQILQAGGAEFAFTAVSGALRIVPEPSGWILLLFGLCPAMRRRLV